MRMALSGLMLLLFWFMLYSNQVNIDMEVKAAQQLSMSAQLAAHDASLVISPSSIGTGDAVFDQAGSSQVFQRTFDDNAGFDPNTGQALPTSLYQGSVALLYQGFIDYSNQATFPFDYVNSAYGIHIVLTDPAVIFVVQVTSKAYTVFSKPQTFTYPVIYQYNPGAA